MRPAKLSPSQIDAALEQLGDWQISADRTTLSLALKFPSFASAFAFMSEMADAAEALDHHPEWTNSYRRVSIKLTTHDVGGLTVLDTKLAQQMSEAAERFDAVILGAQHV